MDDKNLAVRDGGRKKLGIRTKGMLEMLVKQGFSEWEAKNVLEKMS